MFFQNDGLRQKLIELDRDSKIGKVPAESFVQQKLEILAALKRLNDDDLTTEEKEFFERHSTTSMKEFVQVDADADAIEDRAKILSMAKKWEFTESGRLATKKLLFMALISFYQGNFAFFRYLEKS